MPNFRRLARVVEPQFGIDYLQPDASTLYTLPRDAPRHRYKGRRNLQVRTDDDQAAATLSALEDSPEKNTAIMARTIPVKPPKSPGLPSLERSLTPKKHMTLSSQEYAYQPYSQRKGRTAVWVLYFNSYDLTEFERKEILDFSAIYYWGQKAVKSYSGQSFNNGYDDYRGDYLGAIGDHISYRFELVSMLGYGSFGKVFRAIDHSTQQIVAIKVVRNKKRFHRQGIIEIRLLETLRKSDFENASCTLRLIYSLYFRYHLVIVTELLGSNLYDLLLYNNMLGLYTRYIKQFAAYCINALFYAEYLRIIHADIKPENILLMGPKSSRVKVIDWGSGCFVNYTVYQYIQSRFYRAPEVILGLPYSTPIDIWSLACVFAELATGQPLFGGYDEMDQLSKIIDVLGYPPAEMLQKAPRKKEFFSDSGELRVPCNPGYAALSRSVRDANLLRICKKMLIWTPAKRASAGQLILDPWIQEGLRDCGVDATVVGERPAESQNDVENGTSTPVESAAKYEFAAQQPDELGFKVVMRTGDVKLPRIGE